MSGQQEQDEDGSADSEKKFHSARLYSAIMVEDVERIQEATEKHGSNVCIHIEDAARGGIIGKGLNILPLQLAARCRRVRSLRSLLEAGADPEIRDQLGRTTLHVLITSWPRIGATRRKTDLLPEPAVSSVCRNAQDCLRLLCEHGVDVNAKVEGRGQETALHLALRYATPSAIQILTGYGANVNAVDNSGMTPLHMAAGILHKDILTCLIRQGADINMGVKHSGNTALHLATVAMFVTTNKRLQNDISCVSELLERGAEPDAENDAGFTPLQQACSAANEQLVDVLLRYGADVDKLNREGENCLFLFLNHLPNVRNTPLLVKLLSLTSPLRLRNHSGHLPTTLTLAPFWGQRERLLELGRQPRRLQDICKRCIHLDYVRGNRAVVKKWLPGTLYDFVFNRWENFHNISFLNDDKGNVLTNLSNVTPG